MTVALKTAGIPVNICPCASTSSARQVPVKVYWRNRLRAGLHWPYVESDALFWLPNWTLPRVSVPQARRRGVAGRCLGRRRQLQHGARSHWARARTVVWLDYPLPLVLWRLLRRTVRRVTTREELWAATATASPPSFSAVNPCFCTPYRLTTVAAVSCRPSLQKHRTSISRSCASAHRT